MINISSKSVKKHLLDGKFGLERENLRILKNGHFSHTMHPFPKSKNIVQDFCKNQIEVNTSVHSSAVDAIKELKDLNKLLTSTLDSLPEPELLWPFSNPPFIVNEDDIPIAEYDDDEISKRTYREYLSSRYGRYKMTFSGIHVNYSLGNKLLKSAFDSQDKYNEYSSFVNNLYLNIAEQMIKYGWIIVALTAASPVCDSSFVEQGVFGNDIFTGFSSVRCSESGYWNEFAPIFNYESVDSYVASIESYVSDGILIAPSELYYPIRLKPEGDNILKNFKNGISRIELRMYDLNPFAEEGLDVRDVEFAQLMIIWSATLPKSNLTKKEQVLAVQNFKNAAHYDINISNVVLTDLGTLSVREAGITIIDKMKDFYKEVNLLPEVEDVLNFEYNKLQNPDLRYATNVKNKYGKDYVEKGLALAEKYRDLRR